jgi:hypothetical protein
MLPKDEYSIYLRKIKQIKVCCQQKMVSLVHMLFQLFKEINSKIMPDIDIYQYSSHLDGVISIHKC